MVAPATIRPVIRRRTPTTVALVALALPLAACGERAEPTGPPQERSSATVVLAGKPQSAAVCLFQARETGAFTEAGLEVAIISPASAAAPLEMLGNGRADLVEIRPDQVLTARSSGAPFVSVALLTKTTIDSPVKTTPRPKAGKPRARPVPAPVVLAATEEFVSSSGSVVRRLLQAAGRACDVPRERLAPGLKALARARTEARQAPQADPPAGPPVTEPADDRPWGWQPPADWDALVAGMRASGKISARGAPNTAWTNEFLAGEGA